MRSWKALMVIGWLVPWLVTSPARAQNTSKDQPGLRFQFDADAIKRKVQENTDQSVGEAAEEIKRLLEVDGVQGNYAVIALRWGWAPEFMKVRRHAELLPLLKQGIFRMAQERTYHASGLQRMRAECLLALGRPQEALSHAKLYFNMCVMVETEQAVRLLMVCLRAAHPGDEKIIEQFKAEQIAGADLTHAPPSKEAVEKTVLGRIPLPKEDDADLEREIAARRNAGAGNTRARMELGNFLLMAGKYDEAREVWEETLERGLPSNQVANFLECVAMAIRAQDGMIGRANAYIMANQGETEPGG
jgi:tetratricopeptide (TPR) repeat protein